MQVLPHIPVLLYLIGWLADMAHHWRKSSANWPGGVLAIGWGAQTLLLALDIAHGQVALPNLLNGAAWLAMILYYLARRRAASVSYRFVFPPFAIALLLTAAFTAQRILLPAQEMDRIPGFRQNLLIVHIVTLLGGHLLFAMAFLVGIVYLLQERRLKAKSGLIAGNRLPSLGTLESLNHRVITFGFFLLSAGILLGLLVAGSHDLATRLLSWRLIIPSLTWLIYAIFLLEYGYQGRRGRLGALWSIVGFLVAVASLVFEFLILWLGR
jgi:ABC-type uncharacterized transport system permease subunit